MRKFFYGLGVVSAVLILLIAVFIGRSLYIGSGAANEGKQYADDAVIAITSHWDVKELTQRATPDLLKQVKPEDLNSMFEWFATLGPLIDYEGSKQTGWRGTTSLGTGATIFAGYVGTGRYKEGSATIEVDIVKRDGVWRINGFRVNSSKLIENKVGRGT